MARFKKKLSRGRFPGILSDLMRQVNFGIIGGGTVGGGVYQAIQRNGALMASRLGVNLRVAKIAVQDLRKIRPVRIPASLLTTDWQSIVDDPAVNLVGEFIGGTTTALAVVLRAFKQGKSVITANKALLSEHGEELFAAAKTHGANLYYEASVAGCIPIIKVLREGLSGNRITRLYGIVNGTCNYMLSRMKLEGADFAGALADAQRLGYAEAEPSLDVDGHDAAHKIGILASLAHGFWVNPQHIYTAGIRAITPLDIQFASQLGYTIKLLGIVKQIAGEPASRAKSKIKNQKSKIQVSVYPTLVPDGHVLASVNDVFNAILVRGDVAGDTLYYGRGAGQDATASAVLSDLADAALDLKCGVKSRIAPFVPHEQDGAVQAIGDVVCRYYVRLTVIDKPGTLARITAILSEANIGISSVIKREGHEGKSVPLILMIHDATNANMTRALHKIGRLSAVKAPPTMFRVENFD